MEEIGLRGVFDLTKSWTPNVAKYTADQRKLVGSTQSTATGISRSFDNVSGGLRGLIGTFGNLGGAIVKVGALAAGSGILALGAGLAGLVGTGLSFNNTMEQASAKINAFTKDADLTAQILENVRVEAAKTPFEFDAMANAVSGLLPAAKQADVGIMDLLRDAEVLAASNPAEGLEGAAFALREAVSGDFTSVIERFNLPRSMINQLKAEGLPALEIVRTAMNNMGYDMDLVSAMAATAQGRWSTLKDTFVGIAGTITQPIFDGFSSGLGNLNDLLAENEPKLTAFANKLAGGVAGGMKAFAGAFKVLSGEKGSVGMFTGLREMGFSTDQAKSITDMTRNIRELFEVFQTQGAGGLAAALGVPQETIDSITEINTQIKGLFETFQTGGMTGLAGALGVPPETIAGITAAIDEITRLKDVFMGGAEEGGVGGGFAALFEEIDFATMAGKILEGIPEALTSITEGISTHLSENVPDFQTALAEWGPKFWEWTNTVVEGAGTGLTAIIAAIVTWATSEEGQGQMSLVGQSLGRNLITGLGLVGENSGEWSVVMGKIALGLAGAAAALVGVFIIVGAEIVAGIASGILESIGVQITPATFSELGNVLSGIVKNEGVILNKVGADIVNKINDGLVGALKAGMKLGDKLREAIEDGRSTLEEWEQLGTDAIDGLLQGMKARAGDVLEFLKNLAYDSLSGIGQFWEKGSPAKKFIPIGESVPQGIALGINQASDLVSQAMQRIAAGAGLEGGSIKDAIGAGLGFSAGMFKAVGASYDENKQIVEGTGWLSDSERNAAETAIRAAYAQTYDAILAGKASSAEFVEAFKANMAGKTFMNEAEWNATVAMVQGKAAQIVEGVHSQFGPLTLEMKAQALSMANSFSGIASSFAGMLETQVSGFEKARDGAAKLREEITKLTKDGYKKNAEQIQKNEAALLEYHKELERRAFAGSSIAGGSLEGDLATMELLQDFLATGAKSLLIPGDTLSQAAGITGTLYDQITARERLNELLAEQEAREAQIARQREAQEQLSFLQMQLDLIRQGQALGVNVFEGMQFGLGASTEDLLGATNNLIDAMISQISSSLEIHSPSDVMKRLFMNVPAGAARGILAGTGMVQSAISQMSGAMTGASMTSIYNSTQQNFNINLPDGGGSTPAYQGMQMKQAIRYQLAGV